jgi:predicted MFS family arabinose efflux permease
MIKHCTIVFMTINQETPREPAPFLNEEPRRSVIRWFAVGELSLMLLSQMWFVSLSWWLVSSQGSGASVGAILAVGAIPRAACMLIGGAVSDRLSPTVVLRATALARIVVLGAAVAVASGSSPSWQLYLLSGAFGVIDGFGFPAVTATLPLLASGKMLARLNAVVQMSDQISQVVGPAAAAVLLSRYGITSSLGAAGALGLVGFSAFGFLVRGVRRRNAAESRVSIGRDIVIGLKYAWHRRDLRAYLLVVAGLGLGTVGPMTLGSTLLSSRRFGGASSLGWLLASFGVGAFGGAVIAGAKLPTGSPKRVLVVLCGVISAGMVGLALAPTLPIAMGVGALTALSWGYEGVVTATWLQSTTNPAFQGRVSSLLAFAFLALDPVSQALTGVLSAHGPAAAFYAGAEVVGAVGLVVAMTPWPTRSDLPS